MKNDQAHGLPWPIVISPEGPWLQLMLGNKPIDFLVNNKANYLVLNIQLMQQSSASVAVIVVSGKPQQQAFLKPLECQLGDLKLTQSFLYMSDGPIPLLG